MFDRFFLLDERVLLHRWGVLMAQFRIVVRAGQMAARGEWAVDRYRDVLAASADAVYGVERDLARLGRTPVDDLPPEEADLWRAAAAWVSALREWTVPPDHLSADAAESEWARRRQLERDLMEAIADFPFDEAGVEPHAVR